MNLNPECSDKHTMALKDKFPLKSDISYYCKTRSRSDRLKTFKRINVEKKNNELIKKIITCVTDEAHSRLM